MLHSVADTLLGFTEAILVQLVIFRPSLFCGVGNPVKSLSNVEGGSTYNYVGCVDSVLGSNGSD